MTATVAQMIGLLDSLTPPRLAESWDNVGLQIGSRNWPVEKVWTALDPLPEVVAAARERGSYVVDACVAPCWTSTRRQ